MDGTSFIASFLNRKGGVGKTSSVFHLAGSYARTGRRVLLCDLDPQASLSQGFFGPKAVEELPKERTVAALFDDSLDPTPDDLVYETKFPGIWLAPASNQMDNDNTPRPQEAENQETIRDFLDEVKRHFDVILIDCPPNLHLCSWASLLASDFVVVPVIPEDFSSQGLIYVQKAIDAAMTRRNPKLRLLGYMMTLYNRQIGIHKAYEKLLREEYGELVLDNPFPLLTAFKEAVSRRTPVEFDKPKSPAADAALTLAEELIARAPGIRAKEAGFYFAGNRLRAEFAESIDHDHIMAKGA